ncbi:hypothetical protein [Infirmifilum sp. SLHALR2]|nr:MAG: hypothetical protein B7L53_00615 [Thermofilum sp. NZ13]
MSLPLKLAAYMASTFLLLACLAPLLSFAGDAASLGSGLFSLEPAFTVEQGGHASLKLTLTYKGNTPVTGFTLRARALCGNTVCAEASSTPTMLVRGASATLEIRVPLTADTLELEAEGLLGGVYRFRAVQEVSLGGIRG